MRRLRLAPVWLTMLWLSACSSAPETQYFVLRATQGSPHAQPHRLHLSQFRLPEMVSRPQILVRTSEQTVDLLEFQRWAEPLDRMAARIFLEDIALRGIEPHADDGETDRLKVTIDEFMASSAGQARLSGSLMVTTAQGTSTRRFSLTAPTIAGNRASEAEAMSLLLGQLADLL